MIEREGVKEDEFMTAYLLAVIMAVGIPFLLYCLWNFARELRPRTSSGVLSSSSSPRVAVSAIPMSRFRSQPHIVQLRDEGRAAFFAGTR
jgi:hypothetical protein